MRFTKEQQALMKRGGVVYDMNDGFDYCIHKGRIFRTEHDNEQTMWEEVEEMKAIQDIITASKGVKGYYTILGREGQSRMIRNGWELKLTQYVLKQPTSKYKSEETDEEFIERLLKSGYKKIKLYYSTTYIRGSYNTIAMVKR